MVIVTMPSNQTHRNGIGLTESVSTLKNTLPKRPLKVYKDPIHDQRFQCTNTTLPTVHV